ncbi:MAG: hypothetical protein ACYTFQ_05445 [Planctomycetota bacterium]|jgi:hypothetical protein
MTAQTKKTTWIVGVEIGLVVTLLGIAYSAGLKMSTATHEIARVEELVGDVEEKNTKLNIKLDDHIDWGEAEHKEFTQHLHSIELKLTEQTQILKRIERSPQ